MGWPARCACSTAKQKTQCSCVATSASTAATAPLCATAMPPSLLWDCVPRLLLPLLALLLALPSSSCFHAAGQQLSSMRAGSACLGDVASLGAGVGRKRGGGGGRSPCYQGHCFYSQRLEWQPHSPALLLFNERGEAEAEGRGAGADCAENQNPGRNP